MTTSAEVLSVPHPRARILIAIVLVIGILLIGQGVWIHVKASLAQVLLETSWRAARLGDHAVKPWPWADTHAVAKLELAGEKVIVLAGASGRTMAFGPGHVDGTALPGERGNSVVTAHRDTHFAALRHAARGDAVAVETADGRRKHYQIAETMIVGSNETWVMQDDGTDKLTMITCYPFDSVIPGGPLRYVVIARPAANGG